MSLSYSATVSRDLVHRRSASDVLLTDYETVDGVHRAAVQFPASHRMFVPVRRTHDSLLVAECLRQAISLFSHVDHGVPLDHVILIRQFRYELLDVLSVDHPADTLIVESSTTEAQPTSGGEAQPISSGVDEVRMSVRLVGIDGVIATGTASVHSIGPEAYSTFRSPSDGEAPHFRRLPAGTDVLSPESVGRVDESEVLLARHRSDGTLFCAPDPRNLALFDHAVEHLPGVTMLEAVRQALRFATGAPQLDFRSLSVTFMRFTEWSDPCSITVDLDAADGEHRVVFEFEEDVTATMTMATADEPWLVPTPAASS